MSYFLAFAGFCFLIVMHELGHFTAAKMVGMRVERFSLFFPPLLFKVKKGETEYGIGAIPLGGYVRITGMNAREEYPPEYADRAYHNQAVWKRIYVIAAGPAVNLILAFAIVASLYAVKGQPGQRATSTVSSIQKASPASAVLKDGDTIVSVDGKTGTADQLRRQIGSHACAGGVKTQGCKATEPVDLVIKRNGETTKVQATPQYDTDSKRMRLGFAYGGERYYKSVSVPTAFKEAFNTNWRVATASVSAFTKIFYSAKARNDVSGTVGAYEATRQSFTFDTTQALLILALISLSLAIINLFPFLPLDGGHIFWALAEKVRGRPISVDVLERVSVVGFMLIAFIFVVGLNNDISHIRSGGDFLGK